jgi:radical SAM superfamily enzyme YgiQ (UPF0313 family)
MKEYDVVFIHPPVIFDSVLSGLMPHEWITIPMGLHPMAALVEDEGFSVKIFNVGLERKLRPILFDIERFIRSLHAGIFAIDLHWFGHSDGALGMANLCKRYHPNSLVVLGGFTATFYAREILQGYPFIDVIVRGEGEHAMIELAKAYHTNKGFNEIKGISFRKNGYIKCNEFGENYDINSLDFTRLKLMENWDKYLKSTTSGYVPAQRAGFWLNIARGCPFECIYCGGGLRSYKLLTGRNKPINKNAEKVAEEISQLADLGVRIIRFSHDPELFGEKFAISVLERIRAENVDVSAYWESFRLPSKNFIEEAVKTFRSCKVAISPESASEQVRMNAGRNFTNHQLIKTIESLEEHRVFTDVYFLIGLPGETKESAKTIVDMTTKISKSQYALVLPPFPYIIDPHCPMALEPERYGVKLIFKSFEDYKSACLGIEFRDSIGHETSTLTRTEIADLTEEIGISTRISPSKRLLITDFELE